MSYLFILLAGYILGSLPSGLIIGKLFFNTDLREYGSHNIGATNAWRVLGKKAGFSVFILDFFKGAAGVFIGMYAGANGMEPASAYALLLGGIMAIIGHSCSLFLFFKGGKGVATGLGVITMLMPQAALCVFLLWFIVVLFTRYVSLASMIAAVSVPLQAYYWNKPWQYIIFGILAAAFVVYRHRENIHRLVNGDESKINLNGR
ncbi:glycerol-3-phosphate 1-O-acyltransferase PlsY [Pectinatus haikarae]|uniref:Glycerol-3-phosphate acyltransferase n=1 Tax=Pectinatus haikarae TaxID=349096 RepID=A0ABT9Y7N4_9FIRM|nr:glycerol-3-phosphate 1-O-acyltransferase PlsY [Pectinatus haikarae]MDQ0203739.1 glycerol-3-phosphate acyltransferase PlsY [Pectinatus haikarae]